MDETDHTKIQLSPSHNVLEEENTLRGGRLQDVLSISRQWQTMLRVLDSCIFLCLTFIHNCQIINGQPTVVSVELNDGSVITGQQHHSYKTFLGIPYAQPPVGSLRFKDPLPLDVKRSVNVTFTSPPRMCAQAFYDSPFNIQDRWPHGVEDCLFVNVVTPLAQPSPSGLPVLVWIHGGGFQGGYSNLVSLQTYAMKGIIAVAIAYRLGPFGFLYYEGVAGGNMGLKDQQLALKWIQKNIAAFGGDPKRVTIIGQSAGAASVSFHLLSARSEGLFTRAIMHSGVANAEWATKTAAASRALATDLKAKVCGHEKPMSCLMNANTSAIAEAATEFIKPYQYYPFSPVVDGTFLTDTPLNLMKAKRFNKADIIVGYTDGDGWLYVDKLWPSAGDRSSVNGADKLGDVLEEGVAAMVNASADIKSECVIRAVAYEYSNWEPPTKPEKVMRAIGDILSEVAFEVPAIAFAKYAKQSGQGDVYLFRFDYVSKSERFYTTDESAKDTRLYPSFRHKWMGALHGEDLGYVFGSYLFSDAEEDRSVAGNVIERWKSFVENGYPESKWPQFYPAANQSFMVFDERPRVEQFPEWQAVRFWTEFVPKLSEYECLKGADRSTTAGETCSGFRHGYTALLLYGFVVSALI